MRAVLCLTFLMICASQCQSQFRSPQVDITDQDTVGYTFLNPENNTLENSAYLAPLFAKMYRQRVSGGKKINIVHLGDSHILGNYMTAEVRKRLQNAFGDGGRGLIFPYKLAGSNGPRDYLVETNVNWHGSNCQRNLDEATPYGVSGFLLECFRPSGNLTIRLRDTSTSETRLFTKVTIYHRQDNGPVDFTVYDEVTNQKAILFLEDSYYKSYYFDRPVAQVNITYEKTDSEAKGSFMLDGIMLENEFSGLVYHSIGVNGAKFSDFVRARFFARQLADLNPDLIIISFGTNEAQGKVTPRYIYQQIEEFVAQLKQYAPNAYFLFTTPADSYLKGTGFNPYLGQMTAVIREFALDNGYALWDLYQLGGGERSAQRWKSTGLLSSDSVHYSKTGYAVQGKLFYQSIIQAYNGYVQEHTSD
jgi:lysophospholipase L1-like esterase